MMGVVYRALDPALGRVVALKTVQTAFPLPQEQQRAFEERFLSEARVAAGLSHPAIVVVHDVGRDPDTGALFIAFEFLQGQTLSDLTTTGPLEWREAFRLAGRLAEALHHAHARGVVHRDIKPGNVMVLPTGDPKIMDFGIAKLSTSQLTAAGEFFGTPSYMSPEQALGESVDGRSDIFSLGSVLYLMVTGAKAFDAPSVPAVLNRVARHDPPPPSRLVPSLPADVDHVIMRALSKRASERYPDGRTMAEDIEDVLAGRPPRYRQTPLPDWAGSSLAALSVDEDPTLNPATSTIQTAASPPWGRRGVLALVGLGVAAAVALLKISGREPSPAPSTATASPAAVPTPVPSPAQVVLTLDHPFKTGTLTVWVDDQSVLEEPLESEVKKKLLVFRSRRGSESATLDVPAGTHSVRVQVEGDGKVTLNRRLRTTFRPGETRRLDARVDGKQLVLQWTAPVRP
jgi:serine/threonine protein kinase